MYAIKTEKENRTSESTIGQIGDDYYVLEVEALPEYPFEDITNDSYPFKQCYLPGRYGEHMTYQQILSFRDFISKVGDADNDIGLLMKVIEDQEEQLKEAQDAIIELDGGS